MTDISEPLVDQSESPMEDKYADDISDLAERAMEAAHNDDYYCVWWKYGPKWGLRSHEIWPDDWWPGNNGTLRWCNKELRLLRTLYPLKEFMILKNGTKPRDVIQKQVGLSFNQTTDPRAGAKLSGSWWEEKETLSVPKDEIEAVNRILSSPSQEKAGTVLHKRTCHFPNHYAMVIKVVSRREDSPYIGVVLLDEGGRELCCTIDGAPFDGVFELDGDSATYTCEVTAT